MLKKMRHIGIMVEDFDRAIRKFEGFGLPSTEVIEKKEDGMKIAFSPIGDTLIEFVSFSPDKGWDPMHTITVFFLNAGCDTPANNGYLERLS